METHFGYILTQIGLLTMFILNKIKLIECELYLEESGERYALYHWPGLRNKLCTLLNC